MKTKLIALTLLAASGLFAQVRYGVGVRVYAAPPVPVVTPYVAAPGPGYSWVGGYWYPVGARYSWHAGYWARPAYYGAHWVAPRYARGFYYRGYWRR